MQPVKQSFCCTALAAVQHMPSVEASSELYTQGRCSTACHPRCSLGACCMSAPPPHPPWPQTPAHHHQHPPPHTQPRDAQRCGAHGDVGGHPPAQQQGTQGKETMTSTGWQCVATALVHCQWHTPDTMRGIACRQGSATAGGSKPCCASVVAAC
jgi:hypothetical protein